MEVVRSELSRIAKSGNSKNLKSLLERIIVNQIEMLSDNQVQDDFEKDLTARQRFIPSESARVSSGREKPVSALTPFSFSNEFGQWSMVTGGGS